MKRALKIGKLLNIPTVRVVEILGDKSAELLRVATLTDVAQLTAICNSAPKWSKERMVAQARWEAVSFHLAQRAATIPALAKIYNESPDGGDAEEIALAKWNILSVREVEAARTIKKLKWAHKRAPSGSEAEELAVLKVAALKSKK